MKSLIEACKEAMDAFEGGDIGVDEEYPMPIRNKIAGVVEEINTLRTMAEEAQ